MKAQMKAVDNYIDGTILRDIQKEQLGDVQQTV